MRQYPKSYCYNHHEPHTQMISMTNSARGSVSGQQKENDSCPCFELYNVYIHHTMAMYLYNNIYNIYIYIHA